MPICPACSKKKQRLRNPRAGGTTAMCEDCWREVEADFGGEVVELDHIAGHLITVLKQCLHLPMGEVVAFEQRVYEEPGDGDAMIYADWLDERGCTVRAEELRSAVLTSNRPSAKR